MTTTTAVPSSDVSDFLYNVQRLDEIVTGSNQTYTDRLGVERSTAAGAMARFVALNPRGAWATVTVYQPRDLVLVSGTWYIALDTHTSGATFAGDLSAHWRPEQGITAADLASLASPLLGTYLVGIDFAGVNLREFLYTCFGRTAREIAAGVTPTNYAYTVGDIRRYGAVIGVDNTAAITAADTVACSGTIILYGNTVGAEGVVYFPPGRWRATNLTYRGAPWVGAGPHVTFLDFYTNTGNCIDATGSAGARKQLGISKMTLNGSNCTGVVALGLRLGYNQRSLEALRQVRIENFPGPGIWFAGPCWMMSFHDVYITRCATNAASAGTGIGIDPALGALQLLAFDWYNLWIEDCGFAGSAVGGGMDISTNAVDAWNFHGGTWEGNYGLAEVRFKDCINISFIGTPYVEAFAARVVHGVIFDGVFGDAGNLRVTGESSGMSGYGIWVKGASSINVDKAYSNIEWLADIRTENTAVVHLGEAAMLIFSIGAGSAIIRKNPKLKVLTHALTVVSDASEGTDFEVTIFDNDTMGVPTNLSVGQEYLYTIIQEGSVGGHNFAWNAIFKVSWSNTGNTAGKRSSVRFKYNGTNMIQTTAQTPWV